MSSTPCRAMGWYLAPFFSKAARAMGCRFLGLEMDPQYVALAARRLRAP